MVTYQVCPQTPGGRIRALGFARMGARGRRRGPIPAVCHRYSSPIIPMALDVDTSAAPSDAGRAHPRPWLRAHGRAGPSSRPDTGSVSSL